MKSQKIKGGKKVKGYGGGGGMAKHRKSGVAHNHANSISRTRDENKRLEEERILREKRKGKMFSKVSDVFK